jgi:hypothetical protein
MGTEPEPTATPHERAAIFVNYRRADCESAADAVARDLKRVFGADRVFFDKTSMQPGDRWPDPMRAALAACGVVVVCIGRLWQLVRDRLGRPTGLRIGAAVS